MNYGPSLFLVGLVGAFMGIFYSTPPFQWAYKGVGELMIALAYGWLPVAAGYYLQTHMWNLDLILLYGMAPAVSIFMVIFINEFPDYPADKEFGKKNLVVRMGREKGAVLYGILAIGLALFISWAAFAGYSAFYFSLPAALLALWNGVDVWRGKWQDRVALEQICARTIVLNLSISILLTLGILFG